MHTLTEKQPIIKSKQSDKKGFVFAALSVICAIVIVVIFILILNRSLGDTSRSNENSSCSASESITDSNIISEIEGYFSENCTASEEYTDSSVNADLIADVTSDISPSTNIELIDSSDHFDSSQNFSSTASVFEQGIVSSVVNPSGGAQYSVSSQNTSATNTLPQTIIDTNKNDTPSSKPEVTLSSIASHTSSQRDTKPVSHSEKPENNSYKDTFSTSHTASIITAPTPSHPAPTNPPTNHSSVIAYHPNTQGSSSEAISKKPTPSISSSALSSKLTSINSKKPTPPVSSSAAPSKVTSVNSNKPSASSNISSSDSSIYIESSHSQTSSSTSNQDSTPASPWLFDVVEGGVEIQGFKDEANYSKCNIPSQIDGKPVVGIGEEAFSYCDYIEEVTLPDTLKYIGSQAFAYCSSIKEIVIPTSVEEIESNAFTECLQLSTIYISSKNISISNYAFSTTYQRNVDLTIYAPSTVMTSIKAKLNWDAEYEEWDG